MIELSPELMTLGMLGLVLFGILTGYPIAYVLGILGFAFGYLIFGDRVVFLFYSRLYNTFTSYTLLAIPLFVFMGAVLERSGIVERAYSAMYLLLGGFRGGLAVITILLGMVVSATVGVFAASITILTLVSLPPMIKRGYSKSLSTGSVTAGGLLGILIPPSIMLILYGPMANLSVGRLFFSTIVPGITIGLLYIAYISIRCFFQPHLAPAVPREEREQVPFLQKIKMLVVSLVPAAILVFSVLGVIFFGIAPPTEAAGVGAFIALLLAIMYRRFNFKLLVDVSMTTAKTSGFVFLIIALAIPFGSVLIASGGADIIEGLILSVPGGKYGALAAMLMTVMVLGFFVEWIAILYIVVPILTPIARDLNFDPLWFATMVCVTMQMGFMTPPMSFGIFICKGASAPELGIEITDIMRGVIPFVLLVIVALIILTLFPGLVTFLPNLMLN